MNLDTAPDFLTVDEVAELLRTKRSATYAAVARGDLPSMRIGRKLRIPKSALVSRVREMQTNG